MICIQLLPGYSNVVSTYFQVRFYNIFVYDSEIAAHWQDAGLYREKHKRYVLQHYNFDLNGAGVLAFQLILIANL